LIRVFHGNDEFSMAEAVRRARVAVGPEEVRDSNITSLDGTSFKPFDIVAAASTLPFLADRRLVLVYGLLASLDARSGRRGAEWDGLSNSLSELPGSSDVLFVESVSLRRMAVAYRRLARELRSVSSHRRVDLP